MLQRQRRPGAALWKATLEVLPPLLASGLCDREQAEAETACAAACLSWMAVHGPANGSGGEALAEALIPSGVTRALVLMAIARPTCAHCWCVVACLEILYFVNGSGALARRCASHPL